MWLFAGVVFIVYRGDSDAASLAHYTAEARLSALTYRRLSPHLPIALLTSNVTLARRVQKEKETQRNTTGTAESVIWPFTHVHSIPSYWLFPGRQWLTRLLVMTHMLPFAHSLVVDSDTFACGDVSVPLRAIRSDPQLSAYSFAVNSHNSHNMSPDNGVMLVQAQSAGWEALARFWLNAYLRMPDAIRSDDQASLRALLPTLHNHWHALLSQITQDQQHDDSQPTRTPDSVSGPASAPSPLLHVGWLRNSLSCRFLPGRNQSWRTSPVSLRRYESTLVLDGPVYIFHRRQGMGAEQTAAVCDVVNANSTALRMLLWKDHLRFPSPNTPQQFRDAFQLAFSQQQCDQMLDGFCGNHARWQADRHWIRPLPNRPAPSEQKRAGGVGGG